MNVRDRSSVIFGNVMPASKVKKAEKQKRKFIKKFGDDSGSDYKIAFEDIPTLSKIGVSNIVFGEENVKMPEKPIIIGNIRMGFGHYRIAIAMASCARALGFDPLWLDLASFDATGSKVIRYQNDLYSFASRVSQKCALFDRLIWEPMNCEGFKKITYNIGDQKNAELLVPIFKNIDKDIPFIATHVWCSQSAVHSGMTNVVNAIPDNWAMGLHLSEGAIHTVQTNFAYYGYKTLNGFDKKKLNGMKEEELKMVGHYVDHEMVAGLEADNEARRKRLKDNEPYRILMTVGGAGAGVDLFVNMIRCLMPYVREKKVALFINFGDHKGVYDTVSRKLPEFAGGAVTYFDEFSRLERLTVDMKTAHIDGIYCVCNRNIFEAVYATNLLIPVCDLLVTKPSELAYYPIPKLMIKHIGGHEVYGAIHTAELGDGTPEFESEQDILRALESLIGDQEITGHMIDTIDRLNRGGCYNGAYECVRLAEGN